MKAYKENSLLKRKEVKYRVTFSTESTPNRAKIKEIIAKNFSASPELVIVDRNIQETGKHEVIGYSKIYADKNSAMLYEPNYELFRNGLKEKKAEGQ
ncbi:30S ribosomal protein S24e [mine drainage metagenome]|uniref:30S ribosomal protein S24e n=1 Tax=mine drainage metagenome TaxID=410659 RepID=T1AJR8_9ZZZZ